MKAWAAAAPKESPLSTISITWQFYITSFEVLSLSPLSLLSAWAQDYIQYPLQVAVADSVVEPRQMSVCSWAVFVITGSKYIETNAASAEHDPSASCMFYAVTLRTRETISTESSTVLSPCCCLSCSHHRLCTHCHPPCLRRCLM